MIKHSKEIKSIKPVAQEKLINTFDKFYAKILQFSNEDLPLVKVMCYDRVSRKLKKTYDVRVKVSKIKEVAESIIGPAMYKMAEKEDSLNVTMKIYVV